ncbi:hypothetical protein HXX76_009341 [Chlamydomonas incerta]|uniref:Uncharacterized protein n=1 Tax=Chlamydomonas incerta TaxID=51695 RepID=A0A835VZQ1_CHLIN|nr:hypothetical protein HXX76_009341 [Chlamydomonas incerta]|eukprot:KAG2431848.1 hypothetical protein HXX76_009341 [Chlamydomonas incerta]
MLFQRELNYSIYREDIVFRDPRNTVKGMKNYQLIFWSLRFHGKLFFNKLYVDVKRIWQPEDSVIKMRWTVHGIPRVPWEAEGTFDGISTYRLDSHGKIYEHCVDNVLLRDPPMATNPPLLAGLNLQPLVPQQPVPGAWCQGASSEEQWSTYVQRMVVTALHSWEQESEMQMQEPAMAGGMASHQLLSPHPARHGLLGLSGCGSVAEAGGCGHGASSHGSSSGGGAGKAGGSKSGGAAVGGAARR